jgi:membrane-associated phospholipid phosphatase
MTKRLARIISNIVNPFLVSFVVIILLAFESTSSTSDALKWSSISIVLSVLPVFAVVIYLVRNQKLEGVFVNPRRQRNKIYLLASTLAVVGCLVLFYAGAPRLLVAAFVSGLVGIVVFMGINFFWKISLHTAFATASVTVLIIVYGAMGALTAVVIPPVAWARMGTKLHSPAQVITGALLAAVIMVIVFQCFGLIGGRI